MEQFMNELEFLLWDPTPAIKTYTLSSTASQKAVQRTKGEGAKKREVKNSVWRIRNVLIRIRPNK